MVYLIVTFQPIEEASLESAETMVLQWMQDHEWMDDEPTETHKAVVKSGVSTMSRFVYSAGESFGAGLAAFKGAIYSKLEARRQRLVEKRAMEELEQNLLFADDGISPRVK